MATSHGECYQSSRVHEEDRRKAVRIEAMGEILTRTASETSRSSDAAN
jgi:hypothetical protein